VFVYVCICARVRESEIREAVRGGAASEDSVGDACGAGTGCGTCLDRIAEILESSVSLRGLEPAAI
jgi:bacterioferritin-associated ferredoxin